MSVLVSSGVNETMNTRIKEIIESFAKLSNHAEVIEIEGWIPLYGWLLDCKEMWSAVLKFLK